MDNTATIKFSADLSDLTDGIEDAGSSISGFGDQAESTFVSLSGVIAQTNAPFVNLRQSIAGLQTSLDLATDGLSQSSQRLVADQVKSMQALIEDERKLGALSSSEALQRLEALADQEHQINLRRINDMAASYDKDTGSPGYQQALETEALETDRYTRQIAQLQTQAALESGRQWVEFAQTISRTFDGAVDGIVRGTQTWQQAVRRAGSDVASEFVNNVVKTMVNAWVQGETAKTSATVTGNAIRTTSSTAADQSTAESAASSMKGTVLNHAYSSAAAVYDDVSQIPYVGWVLAPAAAAAAFAAVAGFGVDIGSAAGGFMVDQDQIMKVHENERILPARYSAGLDAMVGNAAAGGSAGGHTFNNTFHVNGAGVDAAKIPGMISDHLQKQMRNGAYGGMRRT